MAVLNNRQLIVPFNFNQDAEIHYEDQISKFVIEKQELEWQKVGIFKELNTVIQIAGLFSLFWEQYPLKSKGLLDKHAQDCTVSPPLHQI